MKHVISRSVIAMAIAAVVASLGSASASATVLCKTATDPCSSDYAVGTVLDASVEGSTRFATGGTTMATCTTGTVKGSIANTGGNTSTVSGNISELTFGNCSTIVEVVATGSLEVHHISGTSNGTVTSSGTQIRVTYFGVPCVFGTNATDIGVLTEGTNGTIDITATLIGLTPHIFPCPSSATWSGSYKITEPSTTLAVSSG